MTPPTSPPEFSFQTFPPRRGTGSLKWDRRPDLDPFWVADLDFPAPPVVLDALQQRLAHGVLGYALPHPGLEEALDDYLQQRMGVTPERAERLHLGGLVPALSLAARAFAQPGDAVLTCTPVYPPFLGVHRDGDLQLLTTPHTKEHGRWTFDWEALERTVTPRTRLFILSNPQNPLGRVFTSEEITRLAEFCARHDLVLLSDEIHCDLILDETHTPHFSSLHLPPELRDRTITLLAPSKTYNIAGLGYSFAVIRDPARRRAFEKAKGHTLPEINALAYYAAEAAYRHGEPWRQALLTQLRANRDQLVSTLQRELPAVTLPTIEATYLAWLDCRDLPHPDPFARAEEAGLFLSPGSAFGDPRAVRFNFGTSPDHLTHGLDTLVATLRPA